MNLSRLFPLECGVQHYAWGQRRAAGRMPFIAELLGLAAAAAQPFAELWLGAHPKLPARVRTGDAVPTALPAFLAANPGPLLGDPAARGRQRGLPFLLKVLSCDEPLSIQAHPDLRLARRLQARAPEHYPDANHKPEIAIAVTPFDAMARFRRSAAVQRDIARFPAFREFLAAAAGQGGQAWLRTAYAQLFTAPPPQAAAVVNQVRKTLQRRGTGTVHDRWFLEAARLYPEDRGCLSVYFLNILHLEPGQAFFIGPNEPHAYLRGTIIECMANSDNVVRAGLTPKRIDQDVLLKMLTYRQGAMPLLRPERPQPHVRCYTPPVAEFRVQVVAGGERTRVGLVSGNMVSLLLVLSGQAVAESGDQSWELPRGSAWLWPACLPETRFHLRAPGTCIVRAQPNPAATNAR